MSKKITIEEIKFDNPFAQLIHSNMEEEIKRKRGYQVAVYNVQKTLAQGLREYLNPSAHKKGKKKAHIDLESNGTVQKINIAWNSAQVSEKNIETPIKKEPLKKGK